MAETMGGQKRTHYCGVLRRSDSEKLVTLCGFVQRIRQLSGLTFVVLRDRSGVVQLSFNEAENPDLFAKANTLHAEYVLMVTGKVCVRESINKDLPTGEVEIKASELKILSVAKTPPFEIRDDLNVGEELRLKHRYLDLRREKMQENLKTRHRIAKITRDYYDNNGFLEIETPNLINSTPEGARDYLVPSRLHQGTFYSLPQSPQLFKQLLMIGGFDRYMQIVKCFRDEDLRADRQPEFTQIDTEMSFVDQEDVMAMTEGYLQFLFSELKGITLPTLPRLSYQDAMEKYGSDKPDTRFGLTLNDLSSALGQTEFQVFSSVLGDGGLVAAINAKGLAAKLTRKEIDKLTELIKGMGAKGLAYLRLMPEGETSSYEKFLTPAENAAIRQITDAQTGDVILVVADRGKTLVQSTLGNLRVELGKRFSLFDPTTFAALWVTDFPMFDRDEESGRFVAMHHPFTSPVDEDLPLLGTDPGKVRAKAYDVVINGYEVGGGSIRINDPVVQSTVFSTIGFTEEEANARFGFFLEAFQYGVPPHGGLAFGLDRLVMVLTGTDNIKDVVAFPKLQNASDPMCNAPSPVSPLQLEELHISLTK